MLFKYYFFFHISFIKFTYNNEIILSLDLSLEEVVVITNNAYIFLCSYTEIFFNKKIQIMLYG